jgi:hypothetical protein
MSQLVKTKRQANFKGFKRFLFLFFILLLMTDSTGKSPLKESDEM